MIGAEIVKEYNRLVGEFTASTDFDVSTFEEENKLRQRLFEIRRSVEKCEHNDKVVVYKEDSAGRRMYRMQCTRCGYTTSNIKQDPAVIRFASPWADDQLYRELLYNIETQTNEEIKRRAEQTRRQQYTSYLNTKEWQTKRKAVLERDGYTCQARLEGCTGRATQVHHKTYQHIYSEPLFDLEAVCIHCHEILTEVEGRNK